MENVIDLDHARASAAAGRGTSEGQSPSGQRSENQRIASSSLPTVMSAPSSKAASFFPSLNARELTVDNGTSKILPYARATRSSCSIPDMHPISVNVPVLSTANLPDAQQLSSGHSTGMDLRALLTNIDRHIRILKTSDNAVSIKAGHEDAIRNLRRYAAGELKGSWKLSVLDDVARALGTTSWELLRPPGAIPQDESFRDYIDAVVDEKLARDTLPQPKRKKR
jgi:hypothetical protein